MDEPTITVSGNLTADPELRFTPSGQAVAAFTVAQTPRRFNRQTNEWENGETLFMRCSVWGQYAENVAESLRKGYRVIAVGRLKQRSFEAGTGEKHTVMEMTVDEVGPSLKFVTAAVNRAERSSGPQEQAQAVQDPWATAGPQAPAQAPQQPPQAQPAPWSQPPRWGGPQAHDEPPF